MGVLEIVILSYYSLSYLDPVPHPRAFYKPKGHNSLLCYPFGSEKITCK